MNHKNPTRRAAYGSLVAAILIFLCISCTTPTTESAPTAATAPIETAGTKASEEPQAPGRTEPNPPPPDPAYTRLETVVPPCIPWPGSSVDPCMWRNRWDDNNPHIHQHIIYFDIVPTFYESVFQRADSPSLVTQFIVRATVVPGSTRCGWTEVDSIYRLPESEQWHARGSSNCYYELAVNEYLHGDGPQRLAVRATTNPWYCEGSEDKECLIEGARYLEESTGYEGVEWIILLGWRGRDKGTGAWGINGFFDVQRREEDEFAVVSRHKGAYLYRSSPENYELNLSRLEWTLEDFRGVVADAFSKYKTIAGGRTGTESDSLGRLPPFFAEDAGPVGFNDYVERKGELDELDITPSPPPPVPREGDPPPSGITINDVIATRVAGGTKIPGDQTDSNLTATPEAVEVPTGQE